MLGLKCEDVGSSCGLLWKPRALPPVFVTCQMKGIISTPLGHCEMGKRDYGYAQHMTGGLVNAEWTFNDGDIFIHYPVPDNERLNYCSPQCYYTVAFVLSISHTSLATIIQDWYTSKVVISETFSFLKNNTCSFKTYECHNLSPISLLPHKPLPGGNCWEQFCTLPDFPLGLTVRQDSPSPSLMIPCGELPHGNVTGLSPYSSPTCLHERRTTQPTGELERVGNTGLDPFSPYRTPIYPLEAFRLLQPHKRLCPSMADVSGHLSTLSPKWLRQRRTYLKPAAPTLSWVHFLWIRMVSKFKHSFLLLY